MVKLRERLSAALEAAADRDTNLEANPKTVGPFEVDSGYMLSQFGLGCDVSWDQWAKAWSPSNKRLTVVVTVGPFFLTVGTL